MAGEQETAHNDDVVVDEHLDAPVEPTVEDRAREQGWRPQDEFEGDPDVWVDAKEFLFRGELMERIQAQGKYIKKRDKELEDVQKALKALGEHHEKVAQREYEKAIKSLRAQKAKAIENGDGEAVTEIEDRIDQLKNDRDELDTTVSTTNNDTVDDARAAEFNETFDKWSSKKENSWYKDNAIMRGAADAAGLSYIQENPNASPDDVLNYVSKEIRKEFKHKFQNQNRSQQTVVEGDGTGTATTRRTSKTKFTVRDLSDEQRGVANTFVKSGVFANAQEYVDQLAELGELPAQKGE